MGTLIDVLIRLNYEGTSSYFWFMFLSCIKLYSVLEIMSAFELGLWVKITYYSYIKANQRNQIGKHFKYSNQTIFFK